MRLGVLGGTFNPIHHGHLRLAEEAIAHFYLDQVLLVLSAIPPHKEGQYIVEASARWRLLNLACQGNPRLVPCDLEMNRSGPSYTVDTLSQIRKSLAPGDEVYLILGMDAAAEIQTWKSWRTILESVKVIVARRGGSDVDMLAPEVADLVQIFEIPLLEISSSQIRKLILERKSIHYLVPACVREAILQEGVYSRERSHGPIMEQPMKHTEAVP